MFSAYAGLEYRLKADLASLKYMRVIGCSIRRAMRIERIKGG